MNDRTETERTIPSSSERGRDFRSNRRARTLLEGLALAVVALAARLIALDHAPYVDELNHVLAARTFLEDGTMRVAGDAMYDRAELFTRIVAELFRLFGESMVVARLPAVIAGTALVLLLFLWVRSFAGRLAAWTAGLLLTFSPGAIYLSQQCRFYTVQAFLFLAGGLCVLAIAARPHGSRRNLLLGIVGAGLFATAIHLQILTAVGLFGIGLWVLLLAVPHARQRLSGARPIVRIVVPLLVALLLAVFLFGARGALSGYWRFFQRYDLWAAGDRGNFRYYHWLFLEQYATLWTLFPVLALLALRVRRLETGFALLVFSIAFVVQSIAAWKSERYLFYAIPFFFAVAGVGISEAVPWLLSNVEELVRRLPIRAAAERVRPLALALLATAGLFAMAGNGAFSFTSRMLAGSDDDWPFARLYRGEPDWKAASDSLLPTLTGETVLVGSSDLKALYYFGRLDYCLSLDLAEGPRGRLPEFTPHWKTGAVLITRAESLERLMNEHPSGLVVLEAKQIGASWGVPRPVVDLLEERAVEVPLPKAWRLRAFRWEAPARLSE